VFKVAKDANKQQIKEAVEKLLDAKVESVRVANIKGKIKRFGQSHGRRKDWKKAYVRIQAGQTIALLEGE
jgi:large subunit ribosomal protein L23